MCHWAYDTHFSFLPHRSCSVPVLFESFLRKSHFFFESHFWTLRFFYILVSSLSSLLSRSPRSRLLLKLQVVLPSDSVSGSVRGCHIIGRNPRVKDFGVWESKVWFPAVSLRKQVLNSSCAICHLCDLGKVCLTSSSLRFFLCKVRWWLTTSHLCCEL